MSQRYISRKYGANALAGGGGGPRDVMSPERSRPASRASMGGAPTSSTRGPSMAPSGYDSRSSSPFAPSDYSRSPSPTAGYYSNAARTISSRATTPGYGYPSSTQYSSAAPPRRGAVSPAGPPTTTTSNTASEYIMPQRYNKSWRSQSPEKYTEILCTASRRLRERSIPPPPPYPAKIEPVRPPSPTGGKPPMSSSMAPPRVVASEFYRGKIKSIYEREPLFKDFCHIIPHKYGPINIYNQDTVSTLKTDFKAMVEDKMRRKDLKDPSIESNYLAKAYAWRDLVVKPTEPASARLFREQASRPRMMSPETNPKIYVYHRSTL